jgi:TRAP-type mannitol/chloroaromatic compound transport system substrate-binding protein
MCNQPPMDACFNAAFKKVHDAVMACRADAYLWQQVSENTFVTFMMNQQRKKML